MEIAVGFVINPIYDFIMQISDFKVNDCQLISQHNDLNIRRQHEEHLPMAFPEPIQRSTRPSTPSNGMENNQIPVSQKSNHVSSVLLYGIPIVSLHIEGQERLCLAQISNTLLKQFSYNEIHNRRVALGITCVQCTPVQLEILRRAGAMPVSSRRCGMITRREAERLCKSFLGDNTPPRLPDDFAFNVQHKCAWGCRGSFLPSRYNSSRAKCIKCTYCGMFFSPNKFIFHSHRLTTNDRYIQPDAANFNSWRRHMTLCGHSQEEKIVHAWEDVKAMFNGGTRKRLVGCNNNNNRNSQNSPGTTITTGLVDSSVECEADTKRLSLTEESPCAKRSMDHQYNYSTVAAAAAVVGVTAVATTVGVPFNLHHRSTVLSPLQSLRNEHDLSIMPLSRNFVVDYTMWQQQQHQQNSKKIGNNNESRNSVESCPIPWIRSEINSSPFNATLIKNETQHPSSCGGVFKNARKISEAVNNNNTNDFSNFNIPSILNSSAFKPVVASTAIVSTSLYAARSNDSSNSNIYISPTQSTRTTTVFTNNTITAGQRLPSGGAIFHNSTSSAFSPILDSIQLCPESEQPDNNIPISSTNVENKNGPGPIYDGNSGSICKNTDDVEDDDDEVVDIETTEDENQIETINDDVAFNVVCSHSPDYVSSPSAGQSHSHSGSPNVDIDVDGSTTDADDQFDLKANICSYDINISRSNIKLNLNTEKERITSISINDEEEIRANYFKHSNEDTNGTLKRLSRRKYSNPPRERQIIKKNGIGSKLDTDKLFSTQPSLHIQQRVTFPVFFKSHLNSIRQRHHRQPSPNTSRQFYCCDTSPRANDNGTDSLNV